VFTFEFFDVVDVVDVFVSAQIVFVGESSSACWAGIGTLFGWEVCRKMDVKEGLADGDIGTQVAFVGSGTRGHILGAEAACGRISELVYFVEMASEGDAVGELLDAQGTLVDVWEMRLFVEDTLKGFVGPIDAVDAGVAAAESQGLGLIHALGKRDECDGG
jgi:hypothetical protein